MNNQVDAEYEDRQTTQQQQQQQQCTFTVDSGCHHDELGVRFHFCIRMKRGDKQAIISFPYAAQGHVCKEDSITCTCGTVNTHMTPITRSTALRAIVLPSPPSVRGGGSASSSLFKLSESEAQATPIQNTTRSLLLGMRRPLSWNTASLIVAFSIDQSTSNDCRPRCAILILRLPPSYSCHSGGSYDVECNENPRCPLAKLKAAKRGPFSAVPRRL